MLATLYYQQALRLLSPHEIGTSSVMLQAEMMLNLAKSLEILVGRDRELMRSKCKSLGFTVSQINSQIIPVLLIRDEIDVAHAAGSRLAPELIHVLRQYIARSVANVRVVLLRAGREMERNPSFLNNISGDVSGRVKLCTALQEYLKEPMLDDPILPGLDTPRVITITAGLS
jgi:hypothetical protein